MALIRELREETGIVLDKQDFNSFIKIEKWNKNHFNSGKNCLSEIYYYSFYITVKKYYDALFQFLNNNNINYKILDKELYVNINDEEYKFDYKIKKKVI